MSDLPDEIQSLVHHKYVEMQAQLRRTNIHYYRCKTYRFLQYKGLLRNHYSVRRWAQLSKMGEVVELLKI